MTDEREALVAELDALYEKATKGLWNIELDTVLTKMGGGEGDPMQHIQANGYNLGRMSIYSKLADGDLIVALVNAWPTLRVMLRQTTMAVPEIITAGPSTLDGLREEVAEIRRRNDTPAGPAPELSREQIEAIRAEFRCIPSEDTDLDTLCDMALRALPAAAPEGRVSVPREPTTDAVWAAMEAWKAHLAADAGEGKL